MREHIGFLKISSVVVKTAAWIFLVMGVVGGGSMLLGLVPDSPRWMGVIILPIYVFLFFFLFLIAKMADLLVSINKELKKE